MAKKTTFRGSINLLLLKNETIQHGGKKGIFIPVEENPSIYFKVKEDGSKIINLDIEVVPTPEGKYGNSHYVRLNVGKENREKYNLSGEALRNQTPIVGNLKTFEFDDQPRQGGAGQSYAGAPAPEDMPPEFNPSW